MFGTANATATATATASASQKDPRTHPTQAQRPDRPRRKETGIDTATHAHSIGTSVGGSRGSGGFDR